MHVHPRILHWCQRVFRLSVVWLPLFCIFIFWPVNKGESASARDSSANLLSNSEPQAVESVQVLVGLRSTEVQASSLLTTLSRSIEPNLILSNEVTTLTDRSRASCTAPDVAGLRMNVVAGSETTVVEALREHPDVLFALPDWPVYAANRFGELDVMEFAINDPLYPEQAWYLEQIQGNEALGVMATILESASADVAPIQIAIIDSGIDTDHPEFAGKHITEYGYNYKNPGALPEDNYGHGTHVAGLIGAILNNNQGITGLASNAVIASYKTLDRNGSGTISDVIDAICQAVDDGADIINLSLTSPSQSTDEYSYAFEYAHGHDVLMIAAAGNSAFSRNMWPARLPEVMGVAATNREGLKASYSSPGDDLDLAAPGGELSEQILSTWPSLTDVPCSSTAETTTSGEGGYCNSIGTSMSAAMVSGVAALLRGMNPNVSANDVREMLRGTTQPMTEGESEVGTGLLDAHAAIKAAMDSKLVVTPARDSRSIPLSSLPYSMTLSIDNPSFSSLDWYVSYSKKPWLTVSSLSGAVRLGNSAAVLVNITPTDLAPGTYEAPITIFGVRSDGSLLLQTIPLDFTVETEPTPLGQLYVTSPRSQDFARPAQSIPLSTTVSFTNLGAETLTWSIEVESDGNNVVPWIRITSNQNGRLDYLEPATTTLTIDPGLATLGNSTTTVMIQATRSDQSESVQRVQLNLDVIPPVLLPLFIGNPSTSE
ncbi:MAG: S8 family serine peptidase [Chloroflexota bacterium]